MDQTLNPSSPFAHASFDGKVAVITGGSQGLGYATAELMKARGAKGLLLIGRDRAKGEAAAARLDGQGCQAHFHSTDLATIEGPESAVEATEQLFGHIDAFVNCAAATWRGTVWNTTAEMWQQMLTMNVQMPGVLVSAFARIMKREQTKGSMVLISSIAHHGANSVLWPYATSKHALEALVKNAAFSLMAEGIRVNMLNPGWMDTPAEHDVQKKFHDAPDDWLQKAEASQPFGRILKPQEVARGICFLASAESGMMTGTSIDFDQTIPGTGDLPRGQTVPEHFAWEDV
jgi:NAD(P)-dependent dehydrogenase (short-subunit alcohol dehydrogenase family)